VASCHDRQQTIEGRSVAATGSGISGLASSYATALYALADEGKTLDRTADDLRGLKAALAESEDLRRLVRSPLLSRDAQGKAMAANLLRECGPDEAKQVETLYRRALSRAPRDEERKLAAEFGVSAVDAARPSSSPY